LVLDLGKGFTWELVFSLGIPRTYQSHLVLGVWMMYSSGA